MGREVGGREKRGRGGVRGERKRGEKEEGGKRRRRGRIRTRGRRRGERGGAGIERMT